MALVGFGAFRLVWGRHPRVLARIRPARPGLWSCAVAATHGEGLMVVPIYLGFGGPSSSSPEHGTMDRLIGNRIDKLLLVTSIHTMVMFTAGGFLAWLVYRHLGLRFLALSCFNLDAVWAGSLVAVGTISLA